ncbi:hypothetical protein OAA06_00310 [bacterium]|nr:hypothetical protein [bacterium]MDB4334778.1 hypothetical protein [bacterium]
MLQSENINAQLLELFLPEGILDHFIVTDFTQESSGQDLYTKSLTIYLEENKDIPQEFSHYKYKASGFMPPKLIQDCPVRSNLVTLSIKRRRWDVEINGKVEKKSRDWQTVAKGTKLNPEYASFLKEIGGL